MVEENRFRGGKSFAQEHLTSLWLSQEENQVFASWARAFSRAHAQYWSLRQHTFTGPVWETTDAHRQIFTHSLINLCSSEHLRPKRKKGLERMEAWWPSTIGSLGSQSSWGREGRANPLNFSWSRGGKGGHVCEGVFMLNPAPVPLRLPWVTGPWG